jgi:hypothetical protein
LEQSHERHVPHPAIPVRILFVRHDSDIFLGDGNPITGRRHLFQGRALGL